MIDKGLVATVNSDDPAYFGGYMNENYIAVTEALNLSKEDIYNLTINSINSTFLEDAEKNIFLNKVRYFYSNFNNR
jgi:adenosine deaminase